MSVEYTARHGGAGARVTLIPPSPVSDQIDLDIRVGLTNPLDREEVFGGELYLDGEAEERCLSCETFRIPPGGKALWSVRWSTRGAAGRREATAVVRGADGETRVRREFIVLPCRHRSTDTVDGAFGGFYHWSEQEGRLWNAELRQMTPDDWKENVRAQHELGMNILVPQESFRNQEYVERHAIETEGYRGLAYYPSQLYPGRMDIATPDPLEAVLCEADRLGMSVFLPVGMYAWFDYTAGSLEWHQRVASELWERYGHHPSAYGWYVSEESHGNLGPTRKRREEIITFFESFQAHCRSLCPDMPVMVAPNCYDVRMAVDDYRRLLPHVDILCPFAFHRMPEGDQTGEEAAAMLQSLCDESGTHLWLDMEAFLFLSDNALAPRPIEGLIDDFRRFPNFEKIICYQFPGLFNAPWQRRKPGGPETVQLYNEYMRYIESKRAEWTVQLGAENRK